MSKASDKYPKAYTGQADYAFVSYSHRDSDQVYRDIAILQEAGVRIWFDEGLEYGDSWFDQVKPHVDNPACKAILFFMSPNMLQSQSVFWEVRFVSDHREDRLVLPIHFDERMWSDIFMDACVQMDRDGHRAEFVSWIPVFTHLFTDETLCVMRPESPTKDYYAEVLSALSSTTVISRRPGHGLSKILSIGKDSAFTRAIIKGTREECASNPALSQNERLFEATKDGSSAVRDQMCDFLAKHSDDYDGFIIRPDGRVDPSLFAQITEILNTERDIVLVDIDLDAEQRRIVSARNCGFVGSDFGEGGRLLATSLISSIPRNRKHRSLVLVCDASQFKDTYRLRTEAFTRELAKRDIPFLSFTPSSMDGETLVCGEFGAFVREAIRRKELDVRAKDIYVYTVTDAIAIRLFLPSDPYGMLEMLSGAASISVIGYDGLRNDHRKTDELAAYPFPYITAEVVPSVQGKAAVQLLESLAKDEVKDPVTLINPSIKNQLNHDFHFSDKVVKALDGAQLLLFDLDGTLANTEPYHWKAYNTLLAQQGITLSPEDILRYIGNSEMAIYQMIREDYGAVIDNDAFLANRLKAYMAIVEEEGLGLFDYVLPLLHAYQSVPRALVTSQRPEIVSDLLSRWGLEGFFPEEYRLSCHDGTLNKRMVYENPTAFLPSGIVLDDLDKMVVIEDAPHVLSMAQEMGARVIGVISETNKGRVDVAATIDTTNKRGLFVGLCGKDVVYYQNGIMPAEGQKMRTNTFETHIGGPAANAAIVFCMLGGEATLMACVGESPEGEAIKEELANYGVELVDLAANAFETPNTSCIYVNESTGERTIFSGQHPLENVKTPSMQAFLGENALFCLYDCNMNSLVTPGIKALASDGMPIVLDAGAFKPGVDEILSMATEVISSEVFRDGKGRTIIQAFDDLAQNRLEFAAITHGGEPIDYRTIDGTAGQVTVHKAPRVIDTLGAGDVFHGAYCYFRFIEDMSYQEALANAAVVASYSVVCHGPIKGVEAYVAERNRG